MSKRIESNDLWNDAQIKKSAKDIAEEIGKIEKSLSDLIKTTTQIRQSFNQQAKSQGDLKNKTEALSAEQKKLQSIYRQSEAVTKKTIAASEELANKRRKLREEVRKEQGTFKKSNGLFKSMTKSLLTAGAAFVTVGAAINSVIKFTKQAIEVNREFESSISDVITLLDEQQKLKYRDFIEQGSIDIAAEFGLEIKDVNKALFDAISAGVEVGDSMDFLRKNAVLAVGGVADLGTAVDGTTNILNAYGKEAGSVEEITSAMFAAQVEGKTNIQLLSNNIGKLAPIAAKSNIPLNELLITFAGMTKQLGNTEESATVLRQVIASLIKPSTEAEQIFGDLDIAVGATAVQEEGLLNKLLQVSAAVEGNADVLTGLIPNIRAFTGVSALSSDTIQELEASIAQLNDKERSAALLQGAFNEKVATGENQSARLKAEYKKMLVTLGGGESIFKKIGTAIRKELTEKIQDTTKSIEVLKDGSWADRIKLIFSGLFKSLLGIAKPFLLLFEKITGKELKFEFDIKSAEEKIDETIEIVKEGEKQLTEEQIKAEDDRQKKLKDIYDKAANLNVKTAKDTAAKLIEITLSTGEKIRVTEDQLAAHTEMQLQKKTEAREAWLENENELIDAWVTKEIESEEIILEKFKGNAEKKKEIYMDVTSAILDGASSLVSELKNLNDIEFENEISSIERKREAEIFNAEKSGADVTAINNRYDKIIKQKQSEQLENQKKAAKFQAALSAATIILNALKTQPFVPMGLIMAGVATAIAGIQISAINKQSVPKFFRGITNFEGGPAVVGDSAAGGSQTELVRLVSGEQFLVSNPTLMDLPKGASVFTEKTKETRTAVAGMDDSNIIKGLARLEKKLSGSGGGYYWTHRGLEKRDRTNMNITILKGRRSK